MKHCLLLAGCGAHWFPTPEGSRGNALLRVSGYMHEDARVHAFSKPPRRGRLVVCVAQP